MLGMHHKYLKIISWIIIIGIVLIILCYFFIDKTVAELAFDNNWRRFSWLNWLTYLPTIMFTISIISMIITSFRSFIKSKVVESERIIFVASVNTIITLQFIRLLKFAFGRTWPATWINNNPSWLTNHVYGFYFFHGGQAYASFPSGHTAVTIAMLTVLWFHFPKWRSAFVIIAVATAVGLIGCYYHFVSDVLAGLLLGLITGIIANHIFLASQKNDPR